MEKNTKDYQNSLAKLKSMFDSKNDILTLQATVEPQDKEKIFPTLGKTVLVTKITEGVDTISVSILTDAANSEKYRMADSLMDLMERRYQECRYLCDRAINLSMESLSLLATNERDVSEIQKIALEFEDLKNEAKRQLI